MHTLSKYAKYIFTCKYLFAYAKITPFWKEYFLDHDLNLISFNTDN